MSQSKFARIGLACVCVAAVAAFANEDWDYALADLFAAGEGEQLPQEGAPDSAVVSGSGAINFRVYHVDFAGGSDNNSGTSPSSPWKHAPGDPQAVAVPASTLLNPGDIVRFKGGVRYRGRIVLNRSGAVGSPITFTGQGYGSGRAIFDGADPILSTTPCPSQAACAGAPNWSSLLLVTFTQPPTANIRFYDSQGPLFEAQTPAVSNPFWMDDVDQFTQIPSAQYAQVVAGSLVDAQIAAAAASAPNPRLLIWNEGNVVIERQVLSVSGNTVYFEATDIDPYPTNIRVALLGSAAALNQPGKFAVVSPGSAVVYPRPGAGALSIGNGRLAFDMRGRSNITISGFTFEHGTASTSALSEGSTIMNLGGAFSNLVFTDNIVQHYSLRNGRGVVQLSSGNGLTFSRNRIREIHMGSGIRVGGSAANLLIEKNSLFRVGRSGFVLTGVDVATIRNNVLAELEGHHGNAISTYLDNRDILVDSNCVFGTIRPLTFHGNDDIATVNDLTFRNNIFLTNLEGRAAIYSWGKDTNTVRLENNVAISPVAGMILHGGDQNVSVHFNLAKSILVNHGANPTYDISSNDTTATYGSLANYTLTETMCTGPGYSGVMTISSL